MAETPPSAQPYDPPRIEQVLNPEDLAREVQYAGDAGSPVASDDE
jgi:hypothetical protein